MKNPINSFWEKKKKQTTYDPNQTLNFEKSSAQMLHKDVQ